MTLKELKHRHEAGTKQMKSVKAQIKAQLSRECAQRGCHESLAFTYKTRFLCDKHTGIPLEKLNKRAIKRKTLAERRRENKLKKKRYYEKHGIIFDKTIRKREIKEMNPSTSGSLYIGQTLLYENYKEPLKPVTRGRGFGFYGTVAMTEDREYLQCHICGNLYASLGGHLRRHKVTATKYKKMYGLGITTALVSEPLRESLRKNSVRILTPKGLPKWLEEYNRKVQSGEVIHKAHGGTSMPLEKRNKLGLCPDQVLEKIRELADKLGHTPSLIEFNTEYKGRYTGSINFQHGSYLNAVAKLGLKSAKEVKEHTSQELLENLVEFFDKYGRIPMTTDFNRGLLGAARGTYIARFGTLNNARIEAGLNAILPLPFGQKVEMSPEQYLEYKAGQGDYYENLSKDAKRNRGYRKRNKAARI